MAISPFGAVIRLPPKRAKLNSLPTILLLILCWCQSKRLFCSAQCDSTEFVTCIMRVVNMTSDGGSKLRRIIDDEEHFYGLITIEKLIVSSSASGPFLQRIGTYTDTIVFERYRDAVFQLPPGNSLYEIDIGGNGMLRSFVAGQNSHLQKLLIYNCLLDRIPPTLGKMVNLLQLSINKCLLTALRMDTLALNRELIMVDLSENQIRQLIPMTANGNSPGLAVEHLNLAGNQLELLDVAAFAHLTQLERLDLRSNGILQVGAFAPVTLPSLLRITLAVNKIASFDLTNATLPKLTIFFLDNNALAELPKRWGTIPNLSVLSLEQNKLKRVDLSSLHPLKMLREVYFTNNQIDTVRTSTAFQMSQLEVLEAQGNQISAFNLTGCNFPNISMIGLTDNKLTTVPALFLRFPKVRLVMDGNPIKCVTLLPLKNRLIEGRLSMGNILTAWECSTTSSIPINDYEKACCNA